MHEHAHLRQLLGELADADGLVGAELLGGDRVERLVGPAVEPVDGAAVDDGGELAAAVAELLADGGEGEHDVQVLARLLVEELHEVLAGVDDLLLLLAGQRAHLVEDLVVVLGAPHVGHLAGVEDVVEVLEEALLDDLRVGEEEGDLLVLAGGLEEVLEVVLPLRLLVVLGDLDGEDLVVADAGGQPRQALPPRPAHADQQRVAPVLLEDPADLAEVQDGVLEEDEAHGLARVLAVVLGEVLAELLGEGVQVVDLHVLALRVVVVAEDDLLDVRLLPLELEVVLQVALQQPEEPRAVLLVDQPVEEDALRLVDPQAHQRLLVGQVVVLHLQDALEHLAQVAQVERVVRLRGRRQQLRPDLPVDLQRALHDRRRELLQALRERQEALEDRGEDDVHRLHREVRRPDHVEVPEEPWGDLVPASAGRRAAGDEDAVGDLHEEELLEVVEAALVDDLAEELVGRLRAVALERGHVDVVHEEDHALAAERADLGPALLGELVLVEVDVQQVLGAGLRREVHDGVGVLVELHLPEEVGHDHRLAHSGLAREQDVLAVLEQLVDEVLVADGVAGGDEDVEVGHFWVVLVLGDQFGPVVELLLVEVDEVVVDLALVGEGGVELEDLVLDGVAELDARVVLGRVPEVGARRPHEREDQHHRAAGVRVEVAHLVQVLPPGQLREQDVEDVDAALHQVVVHRPDHLPALLAQPAQVLAEQRLHLLDYVDHVGRHSGLPLPLLLEGDRPGLDDGLPAEVDGLEVDHAAAADGGGRGDCEVVDLEHHGEGGGQLDALAVAEAEHLVVVEHGVHVLDPEGVDRPVEDDPLLGVGGVGHVGAHNGGHDAVSPLVGEHVGVAEELVHGDGLGVEPLLLDHLVVVVGGALLVQLLAGLGQRLDDGGLAGAREAHDHDSVAHHDGLHQLDDLGEVLLGPLVVAHLQLVLDGPLQAAVVDVRDLHLREEVGDDAHEERQVVLQKFGDVGVPHGPDQHHVLGQLGLLPPQRARHHQHALHGAHAEVVVVLLGQLLRGQLVQLHHLPGQRLGRLEALGEEDDLSDERVVGDHHGDWPEERLEVVGQLSPAGVPWVHGDEDSEPAVDGDDPGLELELGVLALDGLLDGEDLLGDDRQHLDVDTVELVEARPRAALGQSAEEATHRLVVQAVGAVEHHALHGQRLRQVLGGLCLSGTCGSCGRSSELQVLGGGEGDVALVGERGDDQPGSVSEVLVAVSEGGVGLLDEAVVGLGLPVVPELLAELEVVEVLHALLHQLGHHVPRVHVDDDERAHERALQDVEVLAHDGHHPGDHLPHERLVGLDAALGAALLVEHRLGDALAPLDLVDQQDVLRVVGEEPLLAVERVVVGVLLQRLLGDVVQRLHHHLLDPHQPVLHRPLREHARRETHVFGHGFGLGGGHGDDLARLLDFGELDLVDVVEALAEVGLDGVRVPGLREDLEELVVGEEVEAGEGCALDLEVVLHLLLDLLELLVVLLELAEELLGGAAVVDQRPLEGLDHDVLPELVDHHELLVLLGQLLLDVLGAEDVLEVHPLPLAGQPLVDDLRDQQQPLLDDLHALPDLGHVARAHHRLDLELVVVERLHDLLHGADDELVLGLAVVVDDEVEAAPLLLDLLHLALDLPLPGGPRRDLLDRFLLLHDAEGEQLGEADRLASDHGLFELVVDLLPVLVLEVFVGDGDDDGHEVDDALDPGLVALEHAIPALLGEVGDPDLELEDGEFELLHLLLDVLGVEVADVGLLPGLLQLDEAVHVVPEQPAVVELDLHVLQLLVGRGRGAHELLHLGVGLVLLLLLGDVLLDVVELAEGLGGWAVLVDEFVAHEGGLDVLDVAGEDGDGLGDGVVHGGALLVDDLLRLLELVLQVGVLLLEQLQLAGLVARDVAVELLELALHALDLDLLVLERLVPARDHVEVLDVLAVLLQQLGVGLEALGEAVDGVLGLVHPAHHQRGELLAVDVDLGLEFGGELVGDLDAVDVEAALGDVLDARLDVAVPLGELVDLLADLLEGDVALLPVGHLELVQEGEDLPHLLVVLLDVVASDAEVAPHLLQHLAPHPVELHRLVDDQPDVRQLLVLLLAAQPDLGGDAVHALDHLDHVLEGALHVFAELLLVGVEAHVLLLDADVEEAGLALLLHLLEQDVHGLVVDADQRLDHHVVDQPHEVGQALAVPVGDLQEVGLLLLLPALEVHGLLLDLLAELHLVLVVHVLEVALLVDLVLHLAHHHGHLVGDDALVGDAGALARLVLLVVEVALLPGLVVADLVEDGLVLLQVEEAAVDLHQVLGEGGLGDEGVAHQPLPRLQEAAVAHVLLPDAEDLGDGVALEEADVGDDVEERGLVHPVREADHLRREQLLLALGLELLLHAFGVDLDDAVGGDGVVLVEGGLLLVLVASDDLEVVGAELLGVEFLDAVDELDRRGVAVLGEEGDGHVARLDGLEDVAHRLVHEERVLDLVLRLLTVAAVESLHDFRVVGPPHFLFLHALLLAVALGLALLEKRGDLGGRHDLERLRGGVLLVGKGLIIVRELLLDVVFVELVVDGVVRPAGDGEEGVGGVFEARLLILLLLDELLELGQD